MWNNRLNNTPLINPLSEDLQPAPWRGLNNEEFIFKPDAEEFYNNGSNYVITNKIKGIDDDE